MFKIIDDLPNLNREVKESINQMMYRLLKYKDGYALMMANKIYYLNSDGSLNSEIDKSMIPDRNFYENFCFKK